MILANTGSSPSRMDFEPTDRRGDLRDLLVSERELGDGHRRDVADPTAVEIARGRVVDGMALPTAW